MSRKHITISAQSTTTTSTTKYVKMMIRYLVSEGRVHDISNVDVNKYFMQKANRLEEVSNIFSDNMMIYKLVDESKTIVENNMRLLNTEIRKATNHEIKFIFEACELKINPLDVKIKNVVSLHTDNENLIPNL